MSRGLTARAVQALNSSPFGPSLSEALPYAVFRQWPWTDMLHCAGGTFYVGHTDDLDARIGAHQSGLIKGYTSSRLPVKLVWCDEFPSRYEALSAERQIKGWGRAKKSALIRGDWKMISALSRSSRKEDRASTGSARTDEGRR